MNVRPHTVNISTLDPDITFMLLRNGLLYFNWDASNLNQIINANLNPTAITIYYRYVSKQRFDVSTISNAQFSNWKSTRHSKSIKYFKKNRNNANHTHIHHCYVAIESTNTAVTANDIKDYNEIYLCMRFQLSYKSNQSTFTSQLITIPIVIKSYIQQRIRKSNRRKKYQYGFHYIIHHLSRHNIRSILSYWHRIHFHRHHLRHRDINTLIAKYIPAKDGILHITGQDTVTLRSDYVYEFDSIFIGKNAKLTVECYSPKTQIGGKLLLCSLTNIYNYGIIDITGCGYRNQQSDDNPWKAKQCFRGIGAGNNGKCGSGAGYGTRGKESIPLAKKYDKQSKGGMAYGDENISTLYLGSAGGNGTDRVHDYEWQLRHDRLYLGSAGGGALWLNCYQYEGVCYGENNGSIVNTGGDIKCDGANCDAYWGGAGSGGSIKIECKKFIMDSLSVISVNGGESRPFRQAQLMNPNYSHIHQTGYSTNVASNRFKRFYARDFKLYRKRKFGNGGFGRIYIQTNNGYYCGNRMLKKWSATYFE
eukprot:192491_1